MWNIKTISARYHNLGEFAIAIVAVIHYQNDKIFEWTAYIGGSLDTWAEESAIEGARKSGNKLSEKEARFYFPDLPIERWRS